MARNATPPSRAGLDVDTAALAHALRNAVRGEVRFDDGARALYATDGSNYRQLPIGVVLPRDADDVIAAVEVARQFDAPILPRGAGTSLAGQCCNVAVVLDMSKYMRRVLELDPEAGRARVEPGIVLDALRDAAEKHNLTFGPDPATHAYCTLGGMIGNNACGVHSVMAGRTSDNVEALEVLTYDGLRLNVGPTSEAELERIIAAGGRRGEIYAGLKRIRDQYATLIRERFPRIPRRVSGYNLDELLPENGFHVARALVGSEGTCVTILSATVRLVHSPPSRVLLVLGYTDIFAAADDVPNVLAAGPIGLEGIDDRLVRDVTRSGLHPRGVAMLPPGAGWLLVEFGGEDRADADRRARALMRTLAQRHDPPSMKLVDDPAEAAHIWKVRESALGATARVPGQADAWEGWEDAAVPPERLGEYLRKLRRLFDQYGYESALYGHFGDACVHTRVNFDLVTAQGISKFRAFLDDASDLVLSMGGSLSGEHGDGQARAELLPKMFGPELVRAFQEFKALWDPAGRMNPHKVVDPYSPTENLRLGADYDPPAWSTEFRYPRDDGSFSRATLRCVGVGACRRLEGGTMCPSYRVTLDEQHSTRGRARLLFEMLEGEAIRDGWRSRHVREALDLCLSCKGCKRDCPVSVDMATYKAEFMSHHYRRRLRPRAAYTMGLIPYWARLAGRMPLLTNVVMRTPGMGRLLKVAAGIAPERPLPRFARTTFKAAFRARPPGDPDRPPVLLWPDTFTNHFNPQAGTAAVDVLEAAGFRVVVPEPWLCCGRPLYDFGMLDLAKRQLRSILDTLRDEIRAGIPIVGLEPSCVAVFRDELVNLFPDDKDARRLSAQTHTLAEFLVHEAPDFRTPPLRRSALVHGHCHHKAVMGFDADQRVLDWLELDATVLDSGCCGMAGAFGFEREKYEMSVRIGELALLPAVRRAPSDTLIVSDGFSCREQIRHALGRRTWHLAEVLQMALRQDQGPR